MSYDLYFRPGPTQAPRDSIRRWFSERPNYTVAGDQAWYENGVSGVYFSFHLGGSDGSRLSFNLNYFRPDLFAREAEPEVSALISAFRLEIDDPQADGMGAGPYSADGFLRGWRAGNRMAHQVLLSQAEPPAVLTLPQATNVGVWSWNRAREAYLDRLGSLDMLPCFVPTIFLLVPESEGGTRTESSPSAVRTAVVWAEQMQFALPEVDLVLAMNEQGARPLAIPFDAFRPLLARYERRPADHAFSLGGRTWPTGLVHWMVDYDDRAPADLVDVLTTSGRFEPFRRVTPGDVLDRETLEAARASRPAASPVQGEA